MFQVHGTPIYTCASAVAGNVSYVTPTERGPTFHPKLTFLFNFVLSRGGGVIKKE